MNTYFLSLLQPIKDRKKNLCCRYIVDGDKFPTMMRPKSKDGQQRKMEYIKSRFPFIQIGDEIITDGGTSYWGEKTSMFKWIPSSFSGYNFHPYFFFEEDENLEQKDCTHFSQETINRISKSIYSKLKLTEDEFCIVIHRLKIGKTKYEITFFDNNDSSINLEKKMKKLEDFVFQCEDVKMKDDYFGTRYKKGLSVFL
jgi:hypothetical protein